MAKHAAKVPITMIPLDASSTVPLYRQLYAGLQKAILEGQLPAGRRLPSTRTLAAELGVSRNTILVAFELLLAEGYLKGKIGAGTYVTELLPEESLWRRAEADADQLQNRHFRVSKRGKLLAATNVSAVRPGFSQPYPFRTGFAAIDHFPMESWLRILNTKARSLSTQKMLGYADPAGYLPLRTAVAEYLGAARAVRCDANQVIIVSGSQQALDLIARLLLDPGDEVWMEDPGYIGARAAFLAAGAKLIPQPVDDQGLCLNAFRKKNQVQLIYVTPSHQFPLGIVMSLQRRLALLESAQKANAWIVEDDYDSEFRYAGRPHSSLQGLDRSGRVIYVGTFSKVMFPALRLGYVVVPPSLAESFANARAVLDRHSPTLEQVTLTDFIAEGDFMRHIRRMRILYAERQKTLVNSAAQELKGLMEVPAHDAGMHLIGWLTKGMNDRRVSELALQQGIDAPALSNYCIRAKLAPALLLGYTGWSEKQIKQGVQRLAVALGNHHP
ncbi:MAG: PLP-dependent aminotransferase family protein [Acidobacteria bacterium]|nr:MAG: PLP-dependent aminotransferase family protein [Acidobacteriota bacterium]